jgi:hypothetical protein
LGSNPDISQKYNIGDINQGLVNSHALARKKKYKKHNVQIAVCEKFEGFQQLYKDRKGCRFVG